MKKLKIENGRLYAYISQKDVSTLNSSKNYIRPSLFQEESILKGNCDEEGYYKIEDLSNVQYIKGLAFIPLYDYLLKFSLEELEVLVKHGVNAYSQLDKILTRIAKEERLPNSEEKEALMQDNIVDEGTMSYVLSDTVSSEERFQASLSLRHQSLNYVFALTSVLATKKKEIDEQRKKEAKEKAEKRFSLKRVFRRNNKKQGK